MITLQLLKVKTRDYPLYEVRGFIMDVARKTFTLDYLKQLVKEMSWYKMNDFQVHLRQFNSIGILFTKWNGSYGCLFCIPFGI